jgi:arginyl-tRNA--protein-N-Asp/Glu arginylyltransferase
MAYLNWDTKIVENLSPEGASRMYDQGYVFTRVDKGVMNRTRSFRVKLSEFVASSENRRIARKNEHLALSAHTLPFAGYSWEIGKMAKDFYDALGADFSANKVKELLTASTPDGSPAGNFNTLLVYTDTRNNKPVGYAICYVGGGILHYSYPFYIGDPMEPSRGLGMMIQAIEYAKSGAGTDTPLEHIYLGSLQRPSDTYKLQFRGGEWFDGEAWQVDTTALKEILK